MSARDERVDVSVCSRRYFAFLAIGYAACRSRAGNFGGGVGEGKREGSRDSRRARQREERGPISYRDLPDDRRADASRHA